MADLPMLLDQLERTRRFTLMMLEHVPATLWYAKPAGPPTHIAWELGHITWAQKLLAIDKVHGGVAGSGILSPDFEAFARGSSPGNTGPSPADILAAAARVQARTTELLASASPSVLSEPASHPNGFFVDKQGAILWACRHEMLHMGRVGLLRRLSGLTPFR